MQDFAKSSKPANVTVKEANKAAESTTDEPLLHLPVDEKERTVSEEPGAVGEAEVDGTELGHADEDSDALDLADVSYQGMMLDLRRTCCGCGGAHNLRSQSDTWPEDNHTHSLMLASPLALPTSFSTLLFDSGQRPLSEAAFDELLHYQENYGTVESLLSMLVREHHLAQACYHIFNEKVSNRLFVDVVAYHCLAHNRFHELQKVILGFDPSLSRVQEYLTALKDFLRDRRALDLLYSYQVFTKDYVNAGLLAIQLFIASSTWDARVGHLQNAYAHLSVAHKQLTGRRKGLSDKQELGSSGDAASDVTSLAVSSDVHGDSHHSEGLGSGALPSEVNESHIRRTLQIVRLQIFVCEAMPTDIPLDCDLFGSLASQCEVAERLLVAGHFDLAQRVMDLLDLPHIELCVRASNQITTAEARSSTGSIAQVMHFLESIPKLGPVEWDSLVSNVINIWILEKNDLGADPSAAGKLIRYIHDDRCQMDAHVLTGNLQAAFQIAQRSGDLQDILHIRRWATRLGEQELLKHINAFLAYTAPGAEKGDRI